MNTVKVYTAGVKPIHLAQIEEHFLTKGKQEYHPHCGAQEIAEMTLSELPVQDLQLACEQCNYQVGLLKQVKGE